jgi:RNA polymerase sigma-70 factor (ECF subfamily)
MEHLPTQADWRRWLENHASKFLLYARQQTRCEADAQDLVQDAVLEASQRLGQTSLPAPALVFVTIRRRAIDLARSQTRRTERESATAESAETCWFDSTPEDRERTRLIQNAMTRLPDIYRDVIALKIWGELTFAEIAETLAIPPNTAASRYRYGLTELRKLTKEVLA